MALATAGIVAAAWALAGTMDTRRTVRAPVIERIATGGVGPAVEVVAIGTSLSYRQHWPRAFTHALSACLHRPVRMRVAAMPGSTSRWGVRWLPVLLDTTPDIALVEFATNDADWRRGLSPWGSARNIDAMLARLGQMPGIRVAVITMPDPTGPRGWLLRPEIKSYQARHAAVARMHGGITVDLRRWSTKLSPAQRATWMPDGLHPDPARLAGVLVPALARRFCTTRSFWIRSNDLAALDFSRVRGTIEGH